MRLRLPVWHGPAEATSLARFAGSPPSACVRLLMASRVELIGAND